MERLSRDKHSSLFCPFVSNEEKGLITLIAAQQAIDSYSVQAQSPGVTGIKLFAFHH
jgi:hypothetical protein